MKLETKKRIISIMQTVAVSGVKTTVAPAVPPAVQAYEGYVMYTYLSGNTRVRVSSDITEGVMTWQLAIIGEEVGLGLRNDSEDNLLRVADALEETFLNTPRLEDANRRPLAGIVAVNLGNGGMVTPSPYPTGQEQNQYYGYIVPLEVQFKWTRRC